MEIKMHPSWKTFLGCELERHYFEELILSVEEEYKRHVCFPPKELIFKAFDYFSVDDLKVVIIGQDPYHGKGEANGLSFSVNEGVKIPPSLRNIFHEINDDLGTIFMPTSGNLERWAKQGILLLNATMTVRANQPNSHKDLGWQIFTDTVIEKIANEKQDIVFILWGSFAQKKGKKIDRSKHLVLEFGHPSPFSAMQKKWFGNKHFSQTNSFLVSKNKAPIDW